MPHDDTRAGTPEDWLRRARSNMARARQEKLDDVLEYAVEARYPGAYSPFFMKHPSRHSVRPALAALTEVARVVRLDKIEVNTASLPVSFTLYEFCEAQLAHPVRSDGDSHTFAT